MGLLCGDGSYPYKYGSFFLCYFLLIQIMVLLLFQLSSGTFTPSSIPHLEASLLPNKLLSDETCASNNNVWLPAQKDDSSNSNFITAGFSDDQNIFVGTKKVSDSINFSNHSLMTEISYPSEKQMYLNEASTNSEEISISGSLSTTLLPSEQLLLETSKDYLRSCELLEEFESTNEHGLLDSASLESSDVMGIGLPLLSDSSVVSSLANNAAPDSKVSALALLSTHQIEQNCHSFESDSNVLQEDCNVMHSSLEMECTVQAHSGDASSCDSSKPCSLLECVSHSSSFDTPKNGSIATEKSCSQQSTNEHEQCCNAAAGHHNVQCACESHENSFIGTDQNQEMKTKESDTKETSLGENNDKFNPNFSCEDLQFKQSDHNSTSIENLGNCDDPDVDCNFNSNHPFNNRNKIYGHLKNTLRSYLRSDTWNEENIILTTKETSATETQKSVAQVNKSDPVGNVDEPHFEVCSVASIMKEIGILDTIDKEHHNEDSSGVQMEQDQKSTVLVRSDLSLKPQTIGKSGDGSTDGLWPSSLDHDYQLLQKSTLSNVMQEDSVNKQDDSYTNDQNGTAEAQSEIEQDIFSGHVNKQGHSNYLSEVKTCESDNGFDCENIPSKNGPISFIDINKLYNGDRSSSKCEPSLSDCDTSNSCNAINECNYGSSDVMPVEFFNDVSHPSNLAVELDCDSNQSNIIFIDHGNFVGEQEIILSGPHGDSNDECTNSVQHDSFSTTVDSTTYLGNIALQDEVPLPISSSWSKQGTSRTQSSEDKLKKLKDAQSPTPNRNVSVRDGDKVPGQSILLPNSIPNKSVERVNTSKNDEEFENMSLPSVDLYDCVSVVYSAYEEESTTFSKLWNPDIRLPNELFQAEMDTNDTFECGVLPQQRSLSKKRKGSRSLSRSKVEKFQRAAFNSQQKLLHEVPLLPSTEMKKPLLCDDPPVLMFGNNTENVSDGTVKSTAPQRMIDIRYEEVTPITNVKTLSKASPLLLSSTTPLNHLKKNSSVILYDIDSKVVKNSNNGITCNVDKDIESALPASRNLIPTKTTKVRENLWERRTPKV